MQDYFAVFNLPQAFNLDQAILQQRYFEAQRKFHPDRLAGKEAKERNLAITQSMLINEAYDALKSALARAQHLLALQGIEVGGEKDSFKPSQELLTEILEMRETLSEATSTQEVEKLAARNAEDKDETTARLSQAFGGKDWHRAAELTIRLGYLEKIAQEIKIKAKGLAA